MATVDNQPGYKHTPIGWIPVEWEVVKLEKLADIQTGLAKGKKNLEDPVSRPYLRVANVQDGFLDLSEVKKIRVSQKDVEKYSLREGDVLFTEGGDFDKLGRGTVWQNEVPNCLHQNHVFAVRPDRKLLLPYFLSSVAASSFGRRYFVLSSKQSTNLASINSTQLKRFPVPLPPLPEQRRIAAVLSTWDRAIERLRALIAAKEERRRGVMQRLLTGKVRLAGFEGEWREVRLKDVASRVTKKNTELNDNVVTISAQRGFVKQEDFFNKRVASKTLSNYYLLQRGDFCYNKSYSNGYPMGAIKRLDDFPKAVVTTLYICFRLDIQKVDSDFMANYFEAGRLVKGLMRVTHEGGRAHGLLNIGIEDFFNLKLVLPSLEEQKVISVVLNDFEKEIQLLEAKLTALREQKKGLMQQLLTGKVRVIS